MVTLVGGDGDAAVLIVMVMADGAGTSGCLCQVAHHCLSENSVLICKFPAAGHLRD
jgi:hypothetical protein